MIQPAVVDNGGKQIVKANILVCLPLVCPCFKTFPYEMFIGGYFFFPQNSVSTLKVDLGCKNPI